MERANHTGPTLLALRGAFLSRHVHRTFLGYVAQQRRKLETDVQRRGAPRGKHAMHLVWLLLSCRDLLRTGNLRLDVGEARERLLAIKHGEQPWSRVEPWLARLHAEADEALSRTPLPAEPDTARGGGLPARGAPRLGPGRRIAEGRVDDPPDRRRAAGGGR
ncbi:DNA polymerase beta superfamily protein, partial [Streptomyces oceani]|uniref:DNA polymerase beta superfamily protein n=1 Tax=Streptomyces oceani TaxID=1075402 RepID=UPI00147F4A7A